MAAHVTRWGDRPMEFACAVALSGRFGLDLDLESLGEEERAGVPPAPSRWHVAPRTWCSRASWCDSSRRSRATTGRGRRSRTSRPTVGGPCVFAYQLEEPTSAPPRLCLADLDPEATYRVHRTDLRRDDRVELGALSGSELAHDGLEWAPAAPTTAAVWELIAREG